MPLERSRVIHQDWEAHHRPVLDTTRTATITFRRFTGESTHDPATGSTSRDSVVVFSGQVRLQHHEIGTASATVAAAEQITTHRYQVSGPVEMDLMKDDVGTVDTANDPTFVGREIRVRDIQRGSLLFERTVICVDNLEEVA
jgi:hypothetical protein